MYGETSTIANYYCNRGFKESLGDKVRTCAVDPIDQKIKWTGNPLECSGE